MTENKLPTDNSSTQQPIAGSPGGAPDNIAPDNAGEKQQNRNFGPALQPLLDSNRTVKSAQGAETTATGQQEPVASQHSNLANQQDPDWAKPEPTARRRDSSVYYAMVVVMLALMVTGAVYLWQLSTRVALLESPRNSPRAVANAPSLKATLNEDNAAMQRNEAHLAALAQDVAELQKRWQGSAQVIAETASLKQEVTTLQSDLARIVSQLAQREAEAEAEAEAAQKGLPAGSIQVKPDDQKLSKTRQIAVNNAGKAAASRPSELASWAINLGTFADHDAAVAMLNRLDKVTGASIAQVSVRGRTLYRVRAGNFASREKAEHQAQQWQTEMNLSGLWIDHR